MGGEVVEASKRHILMPGKLFKTTGRLGLRPASNNWHFKTLRCECRLDPNSPTSVFKSDSKVLLVNCKHFFLNKILKYFKFWLFIVTRFTDY